MTYLIMQIINIENSFEIIHQESDEVSELINDLLRTIDKYRKKLKIKNGHSAKLLDQVLTRNNEHSEPREKSE